MLPVRVCKGQFFCCFTMTYISDWTIRLLKPEGMWPTHICHDELGYTAYNGGRKRYCDSCLSFAHSLLLSEVHFFFPNCMTTGTRNPLWMEFWEIQGNVVIRNCFLLIFSPPSKLCIWVASGVGGMGRGQTSSNLHFQELCGLYSETQWTDNDGKQRLNLHFIIKLGRIKDLYSVIQCGMRAALKMIA